ncbi:ATP-binding protein [Lachnospiraceae bacterium ZAX-1]
MATDGVKKIPIGLSSFSQIQTDGYYYVDKTQYIEMIENLNTKYPVLLRPRRFGKTLFVNTMQAYYDIKEAENFLKLFGDTYIGNHKTLLANSYYVLHFDFSGLDTSNMAAIKESFGENVKDSISAFLEYYHIDMPLNENAGLVSYTNSFLTKLKGQTSHKLYIMVDEYDHFANAMLSSKDAFTGATGKDGFIRSFYEVLKKHAGSILDRIFITGVTSLTLDSLTSGFNIAKNISLKGSLNGALGFTKDDVLELINCMKIPNKEETMRLLTKYYNGYAFSNATDERMFNSNMILYYIDSYVEDGCRPDRMADPNMMSDYEKLTSMFDLFQDERKKETVLQKLIDGEATTAQLMQSFTLSTHFSYDHFISLLYYLGLLTIKSRLGDGNYEFKVPNRVMLETYYDYYLTYLTNRSGILESDVNDALEALEANNAEPLTAIVEKMLQESTPNSDRYMIHFRENALQMLFYLVLRKSKNHDVEMERKVDTKGYADIVCSPRVGSDPTYLFEFKYRSAAKYEEDNAVLDEAISEAKTQLNTYSSRFLNVKCVAIVFIGKECRHKETWEHQQQNT